MSEGGIRDQLERADEKLKQLDGYGRPEVLWFAHPYRQIAECEDACAPYTHPCGPRVFNHRLCTERTSRLLDAGYDVVSPVLMMHHAASVGPAREWGAPEWLAFCERLLRGLSFEGIILAPGWEDSEGCRMERDLAEEMELEILDYEDCVEGGCDSRHNKRKKGGTS